MTPSDLKATPKWLQHNSTATQNQLQSNSKATPKQLQSDSKQLRSNSKAISKQLQSDSEATLKQLWRNSKVSQRNTKAILKWLQSDFIGDSEETSQLGNEDPIGRSYDQNGLIMLYASSCAEPSDQILKNFFHIAHTWKAWHQCACDDAGLAHQTGQIATRSPPTSTGKVSHLKIKEGKNQFQIIFFSTVTHNLTFSFQIF